LEYEIDPFKIAGTGNKNNPPRGGIVGEKRGNPPETGKNEDMLYCSWKF
jgi:hypothetical protein